MSSEERGTPRHGRGDRVGQAALLKTLGSVVSWFVERVPDGEGRPKVFTQSEKAGGGREGEVPGADKPLKARDEQAQRPTKKGTGSRENDRRDPAPYDGSPLGMAEYEHLPVRLPHRTGSATAGVVADRGNWGPFTVYVASQAGADHEVRARYREDAYAFSGTADPSVIVVAVADGVSSSLAAHTAADVAASHIVRYLSEQINRLGVPDAQTWEKQARRAVKVVVGLLEPARLLRKASAAHDLPSGGPAQGVRPPATTLVFAVCHRSSRGVYVYYGGVGDARVEVLNLSRRSWSSLYTQSGSAHDNRTNALPRNADTLRTDHVVIADDDVLALASDGFGKGLDAQPQVLADEIADIVGRPPKASDFLRMVDWKMSGNNDDRTVAVVWSRPLRGV